MAKADRERDEWYPGKMLGLERVDGDWYPGKILGRKRSSGGKDDDFMSCSFPLSWESPADLVAAVDRIATVDEVLAALEICVHILSDDILLITAALNSVSRVGKGQVEKMAALGDRGACEQVVKLFHYFIDYDRFNDYEMNSALLQRYDECLQTCLVSAVTAIEYLSAGCKKNRQRLARAGACFYLIEALRRYCGGGRHIPLVEATLNTIWQLSFSNKLSKKCFRDCGCENELWLLSENNQYSHLVRHRASSVLRWLKAQLVDDVGEVFDPRTLCGALLLSVSDISLTSVNGNAADAVKIANECFMSLENVLICGDTSSVMQDAIENFFLPATLIIVTRRILRFYKKIFHENKGGLYEFISSVSSTVCCFLSKEYRQERRVARAELDRDAEKFLDKIAVLLPSPAIKRTESDNVQTYSYCENSDAIILASPLEKRIILLEHDLIAMSARQMRHAGVCKLLVKSLALFVQEDDAKILVSSSKKKSKKHPASASSDPMSYFNSAADTFTKGLLSGLHDVQSGLSIFGDKNESTRPSPSSVPYPDDTPDGECVEALCICIRVICESSLLSRLHIFEEDLCGICNTLLRSTYASRVEDLYLYIVMKITTDFQCAKLSMKNVNIINDTQAVFLVFALKVLSQGGVLLVSCSDKVELAVNALLSTSQDIITMTISHFGALGDQLFREMNGYEVMFAAASHKFLSNHQLAESWLKMCTDIALARIESKEILGVMGACDICMTVLRVHSLRPNIVQCSLWALCVLIGNHPENVRRLLACTCDNWTGTVVKKYLQDIRNNNGQTDEARGHASLICCSIEMYEKNSHGEILPKAEVDQQEVLSKKVEIGTNVVPLQLGVDQDATEYIDILRSRPSYSIMDTVVYDLSKFPDLNSEPFFRFNIVGQLNDHSLSCQSSVTEL